MTDIEALKAARNLISLKDGWCQGHYLKEIEGQTQFCVVGAIRTTTGGEQCSKLFFGFCVYLRESNICREGVATFNDTHTHAEVLQAFDGFIASLEAKETAS